MNFFKKWFGGKEMGNSEDGTTIYGYDAPDEQQLTPPSDILYMEELNEHFNKVFPNRETGVFHELISDIVHIDVNIMEATPDEPYRVLYTNGMSDLPMTLPQEIRKEYKHLERSELMMFLPADWPLTQKDFEAEENYWPIRLMKMLARFPHMYQTWLGYGHTIPNTEDYEPYALNTELSGVILFALPEEVSTVHTTDGNQVQVYFLVPLYREEMEFKLESGMDELIDKLSGLPGDFLVLNPNRPNACK
ncbi:suppressor of fused domain protein [Paenibacillus tritici]|uniref:Suppressor of fused domain protein n=1 Tax=Paenibacillus tritici TaxID=1873425 RepID=A0ABX2DSW4_9BACL|nr:suppressor of fused domain protein [Paenibacillus tritici]NQX47730.1 suppressor of fused domain protein [Paenibacillus tritici]